MPRTTIRTDDVNAAANIAQSKLATIAADALSGNMIDGGTISNFASTGIDDNANANAMTIDSSERQGVGTTAPGRTVHIKHPSGGTYLRWEDGSSAYKYDIGVENGEGNAFFVHNANTNTKPLYINTVGDVKIPVKNLIMNGYGGVGNFLASMGDDAVTDITPTCNRGIIFCGSNSTHFGAGAFVCINGGSQESYILLNSSGTFNFTTGVLASGTAGTDGKMNVSAANDGKLYFNNRLGGGAAFWYTIVGAMW